MPRRHSAEKPNSDMPGIAQFYRPVEAFNVATGKVTLFASMRDAARAMKLTHKKLRKVVQDPRASVHGFRYRFAAKAVAGGSAGSESGRDVGPFRRPVESIDVRTGKVEVFDSVTHAAQATGIPLGSMNGVIYRDKVRKGLRFRYLWHSSWKGVATGTSRTQATPHWRPVEAINIRTGKVTVFDSMAKAESQMCISPKCLWRIIQKGQERDGYRYRYAKPGKAQAHLRPRTRPVKTNCKPVEAVNVVTNQVRVFDSVAHAAQVTGIPRGSMRFVINHNKVRTGLRFRYVDPSGCSWKGEETGTSQTQAPATGQGLEASRLARHSNQAGTKRSKRKAPSLLSAAADANKKARSSGPVLEQASGSRGRGDGRGRSNTHTHTHTHTSNSCDEAHENVCCHLCRCCSVLLGVVECCLALLSVAKRRSY